MTTVQEFPANKGTSFIELSVARAVASPPLQGGPASLGRSFSEEHCRVGRHIWAPFRAHVWSLGPLVCSKPRPDQAHLCPRVLRQLSLESHPGVYLGPREGGAGVPRRQKSDHVALLTLRGAKVTPDDPRGCAYLQTSQTREFSALLGLGTGLYP